MGKELEALERIKNKEILVDIEMTDTFYNECEDLHYSFDIIETALKEKENTEKTINELFSDNGKVITTIDIKKQLKRLEELEKAFHTLSKEDEKTKKLLSLEIEKNRALEIIKDKRVDICYFMNCKTLEEYNDDVLASYAYEENDAKQRMLTQEEYDLLKEVLL